MGRQATASLQQRPEDCFARSLERLVDAAMKVKNGRMAGEGGGIDRRPSDYMATSSDTSIEPPAAKIGQPFESATASSIDAASMMV